MVRKCCRGAFSVAAGYGNEGYIELAAVVKGQVLQGLEHIGYQDKPVREGGDGVESRTIAMGCPVVCRRLVDDGIGGPCLERLYRKSVAVIAGTFQGKEKVSLFEQTGVCDDGGVALIDVVEGFDSHKTTKVQQFGIKKPGGLLRASFLRQIYLLFTRILASLFVVDTGLAAVTCGAAHAVHSATETNGAAGLVFFQEAAGAGA